VSFVFAQARFARCILAVALLMVAAVSLAQRPTTVTIVAGSIELRNVVYAANTPTDLTQPASGTGDLAITVASQTFIGPAVPFTALVTDAAGKVSALSMTLAAPLQMDNVFGLGTSLLIPTGQNSYVLPDKLVLQSKGTITLPFRTSAGDPIQADVASIRAQANAAGQVDLVLDDVGLKGAAATEGIRFPGVKIVSSPVDVNASWAPSTPVTWKVSAQEVDAQLGVPGLAAEPEYPLEAHVTNLSVTQDATIAFDQANLKQKTLKPSEASGFELAVTGGKVSMQNSIPVFTAVIVDLKLPEGVTEESTPARATIRGLGIEINNGILVQVNQSLRCKVRGVLVDTSQMFLDLSSTAAIPGAPATITAPAWMGLLIKQGSVIVPIGADKLTVAAQNFLVEPQGVTGTASINQSLMKASGFTLKNATGQVELKRNQLMKGDLSGQLSVTNIGDLNASISFDLDGKVAFKLASGQTLQLGTVGLNVRNLQGRLEGGMLTLSGNLGFDTTKIQQIPAGFQNLTIEMTDLKVSSTGELFLPVGGFITFPNPKFVDVGPVGVELRRIGFTTENNAIASVEFSGAARLQGMDDTLPVSGELDLEGLSITNVGGTPKFELGGIGLEVDVLGVGKLSGKLYKQDIPGFGETLFGDADLTLTCLGTASGSFGLDFMVAPDRGAWFVGGNVPIPPIRIDIPATPVPTPPIPLFHLMGFSGGFGLNVIPKADFHGRVTDPVTQLDPKDGGALLQAGLLLADPIPGSPGHIWWADTVLTLTINPLTVDLAARGVFLDPGSPGFIDVDDWHKRDRIASAFMDIDFATPAFTAGADFDLTFPTRATSVLDASGEGEIKVDVNGAAIHVGDELYGQRPLKIQVARAFEGVADISAQGGLAILFPAKNPPSGSMVVAASAKIAFPGVSIKADLKGNLTLLNIGRTEFSASANDLTISGLADFGFFSAQADAICNAQFNTAAHPKQFFVSGTLRGNIAGFSGSVNFAQPLFVVSN
jgi:hypothetical protein